MIDGGDATAALSPHEQARALGRPGGIRVSKGKEAAWVGNPMPWACRIDGVCAFTKMSSGPLVPVSAP